MQKTDFHVLELFCRASHVRASMHRITSLELLRTLMMCLVQLSKWRECKAKDAESFFLSERKLLNAILRVTLKYMKDVFFSWNEMLFACRDRFILFRAFLRAKNTNDVRAKNTNAVFSATKQMKRIQGHGCWKASQERKLLNAILRVTLKYMKMFLSHEMKCYLQCRRQIFMFRAFFKS